MPLRLPKPPKTGHEKVRAALESILDPGDAPGALKSAASLALAEGVGALDLSAPHRSYFAGLGDIVKGHLLKKAKLAGWRYIVVRGDAPVASAELALDSPKGGNLQFTQLNRGPLVESTVRAVGLAEELEEVRASSYELRFLRIPGLFVIALWLHGRTKPDILIPLPPTRPELEPYRSYSEAEFTGALREAAASKLAFEKEQGPHSASS